MSARYEVKFSPEASGHCERAKDWWAHNRPKAPGLFEIELTAVSEKLQFFPNAGTPYQNPVDGIRRLLMPRCRYHVYYGVDEELRQVRVHAVWHSSRERPPRVRW